MSITQGQKEKRAVARLQKQLTKRAQRNGCPTPGKVHYFTEQEADEALTYTWGLESPGRLYAVCVYQCECGHFHHTKVVD